MSICTTATNIGRTLSRRLRQERGQSLVEFAVVLPVLILIILGILYFGDYEDYSNQETQLAEEGVRYAAVGTADPQRPARLWPAAYIVSQALARAANGSATSPTGQGLHLPAQPASTYAVGQPSGCASSSTVQVPLTGRERSASTLTQAATMRIEQKDAGGSSCLHEQHPGREHEPSHCT